MQFTILVSAFLSILVGCSSVPPKAQNVASRPDTSGRLLQVKGGDELRTALFTLPLDQGHSLWRTAWSSISIMDHRVRKAIPVKEGRMGTGSDLNFEAFYVGIRDGEEGNPSWSPDGVFLPIEKDDCTWQSSARDGFNCSGRHQLFLDMEDGTLRTFSVQTKEYGKVMAGVSNIKGWKTNEAHTLMLRAPGKTGVEEKEGALPLLARPDSMP
jgi:hypothetical protein